MAYSYLEGDVVAVIRPCSGAEPGKLYELKLQTGPGNGGDRLACYEQKNGFTCACENNWRKVASTSTTVSEMKKERDSVAYNTWAALSQGMIYQVEEPNMKITTMFKLLVNSDTQTLKKAGFINGDLELTSEGEDELTAIVFAANKAALVAAAQAKLDEVKK